MDFGLLGGIFAFFDTSGMHYGYLPLTIHSYAWHILLITLGFISGLDHRTDHTKKGLQFSVCLYLGLLSDRNSAESYAVSPRYH